MSKVGKHMRSNSSFQKYLECLPNLKRSVEATARTEIPFTCSGMILAAVPYCCLISSIWRGNTEGTG